jgi:hypothetical protein
MGINKPLEVGNILVSSWSYDQTNIDFYKVVRKSEKSVWLQRLTKRYLKQVGWAHFEVVPGNTVISNKILLRRYDPSGYVSITSFSCASPWNGKPQTESRPC